MFDKEDKLGFDFEKAPIYKKAWELMELVDKIVEAIEKTDFDFEDDTFKQSLVTDYLHYMRLNAQLIPTKIAGAYGPRLYDLKMENATLIRKAARELLIDARGLQMAGYKESEYLDLLRNDVEQFRTLFVEWVQTFDNTDYIIDRWGLFNPPGVVYDDQDLDENISFNSSSFFEDMDDFDDDFDEDDDEL